MKKLVTCLFLFLVFGFQIGQAQITVDGDPSEWTGTAPSTANTSVYSAGTAGSPVGYNEWIWTDANDDERTDFGTDSRVNIVEVRVSGDNDNIYFLFKMEDIDLDNGDGAPLVQISVDKDMDGTGTDWLAENSDTKVPTDALWEHLIYTKFGPSGNTAQPNIWDEGFTNNRAAGSAVCSATNDVIEMSIPWSELGSPITADNTTLRFTFSSYRQNANASSETWDTGGDNSKGDCLDYVTPTTGNTYGALVGFNNVGTNDGGQLDSYQDIVFLDNPDQTLNVQLASFFAVGGNNRVALKWITESELNNLGFILKRGYRAEGPYEQIADYTRDPELKGHGTSSTKHVYTYTDLSVLNGVTYWYKIIDVDINGVRTEHDPVSATPNANTGDLELVNNLNVPQKYSLAQNYPNPFGEGRVNNVNSATRIRFSIPEVNRSAVNVRLSVYDVTGRKVADLLNTRLGTGEYEVTWNGRDAVGVNLPSGIYFYVLQSENFVATKKMMLVR